MKAGLVGHFTLAPAGTPKELLTAKNRAGGGFFFFFAFHIPQFFFVLTCWNKVIPSLRLPSFMSFLSLCSGDQHRKFLATFQFVQQ